MSGSAPTPGLLIGAPASGSGKTTLTLGLLRALRDAGWRPASVKVGPDYIDPAFHAAASGRPCLNLDLWAMRPASVDAVIAEASAGAGVIVGEGVMGVFDGAHDGSGSTAAVAERTGWPIVLVVDAGAMAASAAAVVHGFATFRAEVSVAGVVFNRVGSPAHARLLEEAMAPLAVPVLGCIPSDETLALPDRHLGLVQASEHPDLEAFVDRAAARVREGIALERLVALARRSAAASRPASPPVSPVPPLGQRIAVARDEAFRFAYESVLAGWLRAGAAVLAFSPLADEGPPPTADAVYLPGGYPELHAGRLAANRRFQAALREAARRGAVVYGECGGYMALGKGLVAADGERHEMAGLLPLETSFAEPRLTLGYRELSLVADGALGPAATAYRGHEFHCARTIAGPRGPALFRARDARGRELEPAGVQLGRVGGSFAHLIDRRG